MSIENSEKAEDEDRIPHEVGQFSDDVSLLRDKHGITRPD